MARLSVLLFLALPLAVYAQNQPSLAVMLGFKAPPNGTCPGGWSCSTLGTIAADSEVVHGGEWSARIEQQADSAKQFSAITKSIPMDFGGGRVELRGFIRSENVQGLAALWMCEDGPAGPVGFSSMLGGQPVKGTSPWTEYSISLPVNPEGRTLVIGFLLDGPGKAWADDLQLLVDGKPVWEGSKIEGPKTVLDTDHEFDGGSRIILKSLSPIQIGNLTTLGKVWGFLKYYHPNVTGGKHHFDYDLLRMLPKIIAAPDRDTAHDAMLHWIRSLGEVTPCEKCGKLDESNLYFRPDLDWISDESALGSNLSRILLAIRAGRPVTGKQFYVSLDPGVGYPVFQNEPGYNVRLPDAGFQLLALYRYWNIIEYWYPYRDLIGDKNWNAILPEFLPRIALSKDRDSYQREMLALFARVQDTHASLSGSLAFRPPVGGCQLPVDVRFVDREAVVATYSNSELGKATGLEPGDVIEQLDGTSVSDWIGEWMPYYAGSNETTRLRDIGRSVTRGDCAKPLRLRIRRGQNTQDFTATRVMASLTDSKTSATHDRPGDAFPLLSPDAQAFVFIQSTFDEKLLYLKRELSATHDRPGDAFQLLSPDVAYLKLSTVKVADVPRYIDAASKSKGLIIDIRNYPSEFVVFALGQLLIDRPTEFARSTEGDLSNPGAFHWRRVASLQPKKPHYGGKVVVLVDEISQSQSEYTTMAFRSRATVIGSTTAGSDGDISDIRLPGNIGTMISGIGIFYPDKKPTQRIGIIPDRVVKPTIAGIREGRDEVLEAAVRQVLGPGPPDAVVLKIANGK